MVSIIVPTYNEAENIKTLICRLRGLSLGDMEIIIVDDNSPDGTARAARDENVKTIVRSTDRGLSQAVVAGFNAAEGDILLVMDADLSHPVEKVPELVAAVCGGVDMAIGSRYVSDGETTGWPFLRRLYSGSATLAVRPLTKVKDPMAGFFCLKKEVLSRGKLIPRGYKILLEILVRCGVKNYREIPISFTDRQKGQSKLDMKVKTDYVRQLLSLYAFKAASLFFKNPSGALV